MERVPRGGHSLRAAALPGHPVTGPGRSEESGQAAPSRRALVAAGFGEVERAGRLLESPELASVPAEEMVRILADAPNPDQALLLLIRLIERAPSAATALQEPDTARRLVRLLGSSEALGEFLIRRTEHIDLVLDPAGAATTAPVLGPQRWEADTDGLRRLLLESVGADPDQTPPAASLRGKDAATALRVAYRRQLTAIALQDLEAEEPADAQPRVSLWLADLAGAAIEASLAVARAEAVEQHGEDALQVQLAIIGMGKCGARELNYISDVDVIFAHSTTLDDERRAAQIAGELASGISRVISAAAPEQGLWEVDANLRPEGKDGALSRTVDSHAEYYRRWAHSWEFQALLKARPIAGDPDVGREYLETIWPLVWTSSEREGFVESVQAMRRRVMENISHKERDREIKLGSGGLRDVEFTAQLLQLVHGRADESVRVRGTLEALHALQEASYISRRDGDAFAGHYRYLRLLEHRIQMVHMRRTHLMPHKTEALRVLARAMRGPGATWPVNAEGLVEAWNRTRRDVRALHEQIFYRPLLSTTAVLSADDVRLSAEAVQERLAALGYLDPKGAIRHIEALTAGVSRRAALQRQLLPVMLGWLANGPDPDGGLLAFRRLSESLGSSPWFLGMLRDSSAAAERLCQVLSSSRYISDMLEHLPEAAAWLSSDKDLAPRSFETQWTEIQSKMNRHPSADEAMRLIRLIRQREILRTAIADASGLLDQEAVGAALSDADQAAVLGALHVAEKDLGPDQEEITDLLVVAMGRQGGREIGYGSDMDVMFVHRPHEGADPDEAQRQAVELAKRISALLKQPCRPAVLGERPLEIDADLRPEGKKGPLARSMESYREYYRRWAEIWEVQALLRARPVAGDDDLAEEFTAWADTVRYAADPGPGPIREIRRIKARVEAERLPRGADPARHVKLGRGGLSDVEWLVQTLQLRHAHEHAALRTSSTLETLKALVHAGLLPAQDAEVLHRAWSLATRIRAGNMVWSGKPSDVVPTKRGDLEAVARWCGYEPGQASRFEEDYLRTTRQARQLFEKHFYGL
ncbi:bifunctional [glutamine synthetase] adenylyltransferase/[glutamine synthetase]-adenylyl-L-tyrosine phosphorylase [Micrococcus terreus]|uniref:bifunctional [glutamine synthetase] adenylyltransferase/[glutamine synthetase]-adenylyl-L-tyrosine phosphorylase n=1 Tax=Micrococcus terreus TaxID=574650 RepID=UPI003D716422